MEQESNEEEFFKLLDENGEPSSQQISNMFIGQSLEQKELNEMMIAGKKKVGPLGIEKEVSKQKALNLIYIYVEVLAAILMISTIVGFVGLIGWLISLPFN